MEQRLEKDRLYRYDGHSLIEVEPSLERKLPVLDEAVDAVKAVRQSAHKAIGFRPELALTASAMLLAAAELPDIAERVQAYGRRVYGSPGQAG